LRVNCADLVGQAAPQPFDLTEPAFAFGFGDPVEEITYVRRDPYAAEGPRPYDR
jgi:hypothetical protein